MKIKLSYLLFCLVSLTFIACNKKDEPIKSVGCNSDNSNFNQLYSSLANNDSNEDRTTMDLETHSYTFEILSNKTLCKIGYRCIPAFYATPYLIELYDNTSSKLIYQGNHIFSAGYTSYVSITPIQLLVGHSYTIKRIQKNWQGDITNTIGRVVSGNITFPIRFGDLIITNSSFYGAGGPHNNWGLPYIDIVFE